jgi:hypothetical protein
MRRNEPCYCGSGKRFKHCHGKLETVTILQQQRIDAALRQRRLQQGFGKPIQSYSVQNGRMVVIGRAIMIGKWSTFTDFLLEYFSERIGREWIANEMKLGADGHPIGQWAIELRKSWPPPGTGVRKRLINNAFRSLLSAAYNLYLIEHHYEQYGQPLFDRLLNRLKERVEFFAAFSETRVAAAFLKAGFYLEYEDDLRPGQHPEFTAKYLPTGRPFSVEVKTRTGADSGGDLKSRIKLKNKLSQALKKSLPWTRVVFIDLNLPEIIPDAENPIHGDLLQQVEEAERTLKINGAPAPSAYLFLINHPFHHNLASTEAQAMIGALGFKLDTFQPRTGSFREVIQGREQHPEMHALIDSMMIHSEAPATFDGEHPEFAFDPDAGLARWLVGNQYLVPGPHNEEVLATLQSASAHPETSTMHGVFQANGVNFVVQSLMTDAELAAYLRSPETFFGIVQHVGRRTNSVFELANFFYENYKNAPKEKLLEFLKGHPAIESLRNFSQSELAIFISEQWALSAESKQTKGAA